MTFFFKPIMPIYHSLNKNKFIGKVVAFIKKNRRKIILLFCWVIIKIYSFDMGLFFKKLNLEVTVATLI